MIRENVQFNGLPLTLLDTAGLRDTDDPVEKIGTARAEEAIKTADVILWVEDDSLNNSIERPVSITQATQPVIHIRNKTDLSHGENGIRSGTTGITQPLGLSIRTGAGLRALRKVLVDRAGYVPNETQFVARRRHLVALDHAEAQIQNALSFLDDVPDTVLVAEELRIAHDYLGEITGKFTTEDLLGAIFSSFALENEPLNQASYHLMPTASTPPTSDIPTKWNRSPIADNSPRSELPTLAQKDQTKNGSIIAALLSPSGGSSTMRTDHRHLWATRRQLRVSFYLRTVQ